MKIFYLVNILIFIFVINANADTHNNYIIDRKSFRQSPQQACVYLFSASSLISYSCNSVGFKTNSQIATNKEGFDDYIYFFKLVDYKNKNGISNDTYKIMFSYTNQNKILSLSNLKTLNEEDVIQVNEDQLQLVNQAISSLENEKQELENELNKMKEELSRDISNSKQSASDKEKINQLLAQISSIQYIEYLKEQLKIQDQKNMQVKTDSRNFKTSALKAALTTMLKSSIEGALKSKP